MEEYDISPEYRDRVLRSFFKDGKLVSIPAQRKKRYVVLSALVEHFEPGREYAESEVNEVIARFNDDFCTLRRELIVENLMVRDHGVYCRT